MTCSLKSFFLINAMWILTWMIDYKRLIHLNLFCFKKSHVCIIESSDSPTTIIIIVWNCKKPFFHFSTLEMPRQPRFCWFTLIWFKFRKTWFISKFTMSSKIFFSFPSKTFYHSWITCLKFWHLFQSKSNDGLWLIVEMCIFTSIFIMIFNFFRRIDSNHRQAKFTTSSKFISPKRWKAQSSIKSIMMCVKNIKWHWRRLCYWI